jgi:hypothetical protein
VGAGCAIEGLSFGKHVEPEEGRGHHPFCSRFLKNDGTTAYKR